MTTRGLLILVGILSVVRGVFLLFPRFQVPAVGLKAALLVALAATYRFAMPVDAEPTAPQGPLRLALVFGLALLAIALLPNGEPARTSADAETSPPPPLPDADVASAATPPSVDAEPRPSVIFNVWSNSQTRAALEVVDSVIIAGLTALVLIWFVIRSFYIPSESMVPTLQINDMILVDELVYRLYRPARGDIVVFRPPPRAHSEGKDFIKRVLAVEGDTVAVVNDVTHVNGRPVDEPYRNTVTAPEDWAVGRTFEPLTVPRGHVFCMGDNRACSEDSRYWGTVPVENIIGKAFLIFYPLARARVLR